MSAEDKQDTAVDPIAALAAHDAATDRFAASYARKRADFTMVMVEQGGKLVGAMLRTLRPLGLDKSEQDKALVQYLKDHGVADRSAGALRDWNKAHEVWQDLTAEQRDKLRPVITVYALRDMHGAPSEPDEENPDKLTRSAVADKLIESGETTDAGMREVIAQARGKQPKGETVLTLSQQAGLVSDWFKQEGRTDALRSWFEEIGDEEIVAAIFQAGAQARADLGKRTIPAFGIGVRDSIALLDSTPVVDEDGDGLLVKVDPAAVLAEEVATA